MIYCLSRRTTKFSFSDENMDPASHGDVSLMPTLNKHKLGSSLVLVGRSRPPGLNSRILSRKAQTKGSSTETSSQAKQSGGSHCRKGLSSAAAKQTKRECEADTGGPPVPRQLVEMLWPGQPSTATALRSEVPFAPH